MGQMFMKPGTPATINVGEHQFSGEAVCVSVEYEDPRTRAFADGTRFVTSRAPEITCVKVTMRNGFAEQATAAEDKEIRRLRELAHWERITRLEIPAPHEAIVGWVGPHGFGLRLPREDNLCACCGRVIYAYTESLAECRARIGMDEASRFRANKMIAAWNEPRAAAGGGARYAHTACLYRITRAGDFGDYLKVPGALSYRDELLKGFDEKGEQHERVMDKKDSGIDIRDAWQCEVQKARDGLAKAVKTAVVLEKKLGKAGEPLSAECFTILEPRKGDVVMVPYITTGSYWTIVGIGKGRPGIVGCCGSTLDLELHNTAKTKAAVALSDVRFVERPDAPKGFGKGAAYGQRVTL